MGIYRKGFVDIYTIISFKKPVPISVLNIKKYIVLFQRSKLKARWNGCWNNKKHWNTEIFYTKKPTNYFPEFFSGKM